MNVIVIDDEKDIRESLYSLLEEEGHQVYLAADGLQGIELMRTKTHPAIVFLDLLMPRMGGDEVLRIFNQDSVLQQRYQITIITATINKFPNDLSRIIRKFHIKVFQKPLNVIDILDILEQSVNMPIFN